MAVVVNIGIVDNGSPIDDTPYIRPGCAVAVYIGLHEMTIAYKSPVRIRNPRSDVDGYIDIQPGTEGCPSVVATSITPGHPGRAPFVAGNPHPAVVIIKMPPAVVKRPPAPFVI
jgi:hypothetical protein